MKRRGLIYAGTSAAALVALVIVFQGQLRRWLVSAFSQDYVPPEVASSEGPSPQLGLKLVKVAEGLRWPTDIQFVPGRQRQAVILEKAGTARLVTLSAPGEAPARADAAPLVVELQVRAASELGLLGLTFHPDYEQNGRLYINYNPKAGALRTVIAELELPLGELGRRKAVLRRTLLEVSQPYQNHDAGQLAFGPDGLLYIGLGDGGWRDDPHGHGQNPGTLLGTMLRIDPEPDGDKPYSIPPDNPLLDRADARPEVWAYGIRNPWRFSWDQKGRMVLADVGQNEWEEVNLVRAGDNLGWKIREARHCFDPPVDCASEGLVDPIYEYDHTLGKSITGGYVVTSQQVPKLTGRYLFADFTDGRVWALELPNERRADAPLASAELLGRWPYLISTFGRDAAGEVYLADYSRGDIYQFVSAAAESAR